MSLRTNMTLLTILLLAASSVRAGQIEAYPIPASAEIATGTDSRGTKAPALPAPESKSVLVVAPRNGVANGQILLRAKGGAYSSRPGEPAKAGPVSTAVALSDLAGPEGAVLAATDAQVRYGQYISGEKGLSVYRWQKDIGVSAKAAEEKAAAYAMRQGYWRVDCLLPTKECEVDENLPRCAWLTFRVGPGAKPGVYKGTATARGADATIPVELEVVDAVVPDLAASAMSNDIRPMWEVIALGNGIPLDECWKSERFWDMTAAYLEKLGQLRVNNCGISILAPSTSSCLGMVKWTKKGEQWSWDYSVLDRFIATYRKAVGEPRVVDATALVHNEQKPELSFLCIDADGKLALQTLPDDPEAADVAAAFVKDLTAHLATLKLDKKLVVGVWHDKMQHTGGTIRQRGLLHGQGQVAAT